MLRQSRWHIDSSVVPSRFGTTHGWRKNTDARGERFLFREQNPASAKMFTMDFDLTIHAPSRERKKKFHLAKFNIYKKLKRMKVSLVETTTGQFNLFGWILNTRPGNHISIVYVSTYTRTINECAVEKLSTLSSNVRILSRRLIWSEKNIFHVYYSSGFLYSFI